MIAYLNSEFQLSRTNGSRVIEKGHSSFFEVCHTLLSCRSTLQIRFSTYIPNFSFLEPTVQELLKKGVAALLKYAMPVQVADLSYKSDYLPIFQISAL